MRLPLVLNCSDVYQHRTSNISSQHSDQVLQLANDEQTKTQPYLHCKTAALLHMVSQKLLRSGYQAQALVVSLRESV